jgi:hypothetical protein
MGRRQHGAAALWVGAAVSMAFLEAGHLTGRPGA